MKNEYKRVGCDFYDQLESYATLKKKIAIQYIDSSSSNSVYEEITIKTLETKNKEEFLISTSGLRIRLDKIISLNDLG